MLVILVFFQDCESLLFSLCLCPPPEKKENVIFALSLHGGHLGFFEGAVLFPQPLTWMDKVIVGYANAMCQWEKQKPQCLVSGHTPNGPCQKEATQS